MLERKLNDVEMSDLLALVENGVREGRTIEYKVESPGTTDSAKKEFLADVSSFANASGGDLIYGVVEELDEKGKSTGIPATIDGLSEVNGDAEVLRLEQMIRGGLEPRIPGVELRVIDGFPKGPVIVIRIPKSWAAPHMVTFKSSPKFFARTSAGKMPLGVPEIKAAFLQSESIPQQIRDFRTERLGRILASESPVVMASGSVVVLHLVPLASFAEPTKLDVASLLDGHTPLPPLGSSGWNRRLNLDGLLTYAGGGESYDSQWSYAQLFRNGTIESVNASLLDCRGKEAAFIPSGAMERDVIQNVNQYLELFKQTGISGPVVAMFSLLGVKGYHLLTSGRILREVHYAMEPNLVFPEIVIDEIHGEASRQLRPMFDLMWQAFGYRQSCNYDEEGNWSCR